MNTDVKFPDVHVKLTGADGNAFSVIAKVCSALKRGGATDNQLDKYTTESMEGDYNHLLRVAMRWVDVS